MAGALAALPCVAARTVEAWVGTVARGLGRIFDALAIAGLEDFDPQAHVASAAAGHIARLKPSMGVAFIDASRALQQALDDWLALYPDCRSSFATYQVSRPDRFERAAVAQAEKRAEGTCFALAPLLMAARFGEFTLAMLSAHTSTRCPRVSELQQLALDAIQVGADGVWFYRPRVKGGAYEDIPISAEAAHAAIGLADALRQAYRLPPTARLPLVVPRTLKVPAPPAEYLFQFGGRFIDAQSLNACLRFLLFGIARGAGMEPRLHAHLFRHGFANARLQAGEPAASVADGLTHSDMETTRRRYGYPTRSQACAAMRRRRP